MTIQQLRVFLNSWACGCGSPESAFEGLKAILELHPLHDHRPEIEALIPDERLEYLILYMLDHLDLTEHGGTVGGGWLTETGQAVLDALRTFPMEDITRDSCSHGYAVETDELLQCPECGPMNRALKSAVREGAGE